MWPHRISRFIASVFEHWGALVTGGVFIGALSVWQNTGHSVRPLVYWAVAFVTLFIAFFRAWNDEVNAKEKALAQLANLEKTVKATADANDVSATDWKNLGKEFQGLPGRIRADWHRDGDGTESWILLHPACKGLCTLAGAMLTKSPRVFAMLSQKVPPGSDAMSRWLRFLKERQPIRVQHCYETMPEGQQKIILFGSIEDVRENSFTACIECAAAET